MRYCTLLALDEDRKLIVQAARNVQIEQRSEN